jgi:hypothetical protein
MKNADRIENLLNLFSYICGWGSGWKMKNVDKMPTFHARISDRGVTRVELDESEVALNPKV